MANRWDVVRNVGWGDVAVQMAPTETAEATIARGCSLDVDTTPLARWPKQPDETGRIVVQRGPLSLVARAEVKRVPLDITAEPRDPVTIPWPTVISSLVAGGVVAALFSPLFAILAAVSAVGLIGRSAASRRSWRRACAQRTVDLERAAHDLGQAADQWALNEAARRRSLVNGPDEVLEMLRAGAFPWQELAATELSLSVGRGRLDVPPDLDPVTADPEAVALVPPTVMIDDVPVVANGGEGEGLAITGDRAPALDLARWLVLEQVSRHGPSTLPLRIVTTTDRLVDWDWAKWLPSLVEVAVGDVESQQCLERATESETGGLLVVDGVEATAAGLLAHVLSGTDVSHRVLWVGGRDDVPAVCATIVEVTPDGAAGVVSESFASTVTSVWSVSFDVAREWARMLAPFVDPLASDVSRSLPSHLGIDEVGEAPFSSLWPTATPDRLIATVGAMAGDELTVDLVADGPHALVAGTTGAGKSEFLRTLVTGLALRQPPELLNVVLVDFKGGGAFDPVSSLPHVAAVVTDLDAAAAARALTSMRAELKSREELLRCLGVSDVSDLDQQRAVELPRLVLVVDEFATLADELPDFLDGLVDIARRGRSLGVHLVLATQRPAGVVTGQIRANTNLRVCLRVQDRNDSTDVIDQPDGAMLPAIPGRALVAVGAAAPTLVQVASVSGAAAEVGVEPFVIHPSIFQADRVMASAYANSLAKLNASAAEDQRHAGAFSLDTLSAEMRAATSTRAKAPWLEPLDVVAIDDVADLLGEGQHVVPLGLLDNPEQRRYEPFAWSSHSAGLLILGSRRASVEHAVRLAVVGLVEQRQPVYLLDGLGDLEDLGRLAGVGDVLSARDPERLVKAVRFLARLVRAGQPPAVAVHGWASVADALESACGPDVRLELERLVREGISAGAPVLITGASDRDVPGRVRSRLACRVLQQLADPSSFTMFGLRSAPSLAHALSFVDPDSGLTGVLSELTPTRLERVRTLRPHGGLPTPVQVLGASVDAADLPSIVSAGSSHLLPVGLDEELEVHSIDLRPDRPLVVLGEPTGGRTSIVDRIEQRLAEATPLVVDDADFVSREDGLALANQARCEARPLVIAASPRSARGFDSWIAKLLPESTVVMVNPTSRDGEVCRVAIPDLRDAPPGRSVVVDRGRVNVVQLAA